MSGKFKNFWITSIILAYLSLNYLPGFGWWISMVGTGLILLFGYFAWPKNYRERLGIPTNARQYFFTFILLILFLLGSYYLINLIRIQKNLGFKMGLIHNFAHIFFYTLNEELVLGGILLVSLKIRYVKVKPLVISIGVALIFSILHYIFYRWNFQGSTRGILTNWALVSLLMVGIIRNNLILKTGHVGYSWALHFSWMAVMLGCIFYFPGGTHKLSQTARFNLFIGHKLTIVILSMVMILTSAWIQMNGIKVPHKLRNVFQ